MKHKSALTRFLPVLWLQLQASSAVLRFLSGIWPLTSKFGEGFGLEGVFGMCLPQIFPIILWYIVVGKVLSARIPGILQFLHSFCLGHSGVMESLEHASSTQVPVSSRFDAYGTVTPFGNDVRDHNNLFLNISLNVLFKILAYLPIVWPFPREKRNWISKADTMANCILLNIWKEQSNTNMAWPVSRSNNEGNISIRGKMQIRHIFGVQNPFLNYFDDYESDVSFPSLQKLKTANYFFFWNIFSICIA